MYKTAQCAVWQQPGSWGSAINQADSPPRPWIDFPPVPARGTTLAGANFGEPKLWCTFSGIQRVQKWLFSRLKYCQIYKVFNCGQKLEKNWVKILLFRQNILMVEGEGSSRCLGDYSKSWIQILSGDIENLSTNHMTELGNGFIIRFTDISRNSYYWKYYIDIRYSYWDISFINVYQYV